MGLTNRFDMVRLPALQLKSKRCDVVGQLVAAKSTHDIQYINWRVIFLAVHNTPLIWTHSLHIYRTYINIRYENSFLLKASIVFRGALYMLNNFFSKDNGLYNFHILPKRKYQRLQFVIRNHLNCNQ